MSNLRVEVEHAYGGDDNYHIVESTENNEDEVVAVVYGRPDIAYGMVQAVNLMRKM